MFGFSAGFVLVRNGSVQSGLSTGLADLDKLIRGLRKKTVTIVAGLPGSGKTTLGLQIAQHIACTGLGVGMVFSLEMPEEELANRALASLGSIDLQLLDNGKLEDDDWPRLTSAVNKIMDKPLYVSDKSGLTVPRIRSICRQVTRMERRRHQRRLRRTAGSLLIIPFLARQLSQ